jgi:hypothetical protein
VERMAQRTVLMVVAWLVPAVATAAVGMAALNIVGAGILGPTNQPLSQQDVARQLASATARPLTSDAPSTSSSVPATPPGVRPLDTPGGTIFAYCEGDLAVLFRWTPALGYRDTVDDAKRGPAAVASIRFIKGKSEVDVSVTCHAGVPQAATSTESH